MAWVVNIPGNEAKRGHVNIPVSAPAVRLLETWEGREPPNPPVFSGARLGTLGAETVPTDLSSLRESEGPEDAVRCQGVCLTRVTARPPQSYLSKASARNANDTPTPSSK